MSREYSVVLLGSKTSRGIKFRLKNRQIHVLKTVNLHYRTLDYSFWSFALESRTLYILSDTNTTFHQTTFNLHKDISEMTKQLSDYIDENDELFDDSEKHFSWAPLQLTVNPEVSKPTLKVAVFSINQQGVQMREQLFKNGIKIEHDSPSELGVYSFLHSWADPEVYTLALYCSYDKTYMMIVNKRNIVLIREISKLNYSVLIESLQQKLSVGRLEAEELLQHIGVDYGENDSLSLDVRVAIENNIELVSKELNKQLKHLRDTENIRIDRAVILGELGGVQGIGQYFTQKTTLNWSEIPSGISLTVPENSQELPHVLQTSENFPLHLYAPALGMASFESGQTDPEKSYPFHLKFLKTAISILALIIICLVIFANLEFISNKIFGSFPKYSKIIEVGSKDQRGLQNLADYGIDLKRVAPDSASSLEVSEIDDVPKEDVDIPLVALKNSLNGIGSYGVPKDTLLELRGYALKEVEIQQFKSKLDATGYWKTSAISIEKPAAPGKEYKFILYYGW